MAVRWLTYGVSVCCLALLFASLASAAEAPGVRLKTITPAPSDAALVNLGMGLYLYGTLNPDDMSEGAWYRDLIAIGYFRDDWAELLGDSEGQYRFDAYFTPIFDLWVKQWGKRVAFRFMSSNMHSQREYVLPKWVYDSGVPSVVHKGLYVPRQVDPVFWNERYLQHQEKLIAALGRYLDGRPGLEFIDIGDIGEWGEMHLSRWTPEELRRTGFSEDAYIAAYRRLIDAYARAFPHTRVFLNVGDYAAINDYAALRGLHFRQDGLTPSGPSADVGKRFYQSYARRGVVCNYEFHSGYDEMLRKGWGIKETFAKGLEDPISYLHLNVTSYDQLKDPPAELKECVLDAARRIGFRFVLKELRTNETVRMDGPHPGRLILEQIWRNEGVAPCYESYALRWSLVDDGGKTAAESLTFPRTPTDLWWPGEEVRLSALLPVPANLAPGMYHLKAHMLKPEDPAQQVQLGLANRDSLGRYNLGEVRLLRAAPQARTLPLDLAQCEPAPGLRLTREGDTIFLTGTQPGNSWQYATIGRVPAVPYGRYRLSGWMKVDRLEPGPAPYLKIGENDREGKWITNFNTNPYDLSRLGTWQHLTVEADTAAEAGSLDVCVERGVLEGPISAGLALRDITLELVEAP